VHCTVNPDITSSTTDAPAEEDEGGAGETSTDPDKTIINARPAIYSDGLLTTTELVELYATPARSAYDEGLLKHRQLTNDVVTCGDRFNMQPSRRGANEPEWTSYTHYWKTVLGTIRPYF
jgi:RNA exonuclease NGL2